MLDIVGCVFGIFEVTGILINLILTPVDWMWRLFGDDRGLFPDRVKDPEEKPKRDKQSQEPGS